MYKLSTNVPSSTVAAKSVSLPGISSSWFVPLKTAAGDYVFKNTAASGLGRPNATVQLAHNMMGSIYERSGIAKVAQLPDKSGIKVYFQMRQSWTIADTEQPLAPEYQVAPSVSITLNVPNNELVTADVMQQLLLDAVAHLLNMEGRNILLDLASGSLDIRVAP